MFSLKKSFKNSTVCIILLSMISSCALPKDSGNVEEWDRSKNHDYYINMSLQFVKKKKFKKALFFAEKALKISEEAKNDGKIINDLTALSILNWKLGNNEKALNALKRRYSIYKKKGMRLDEFYFDNVKVISRIIPYQKEKDLIPILEFMHSMSVEIYGDYHKHEVKMRQTLAYTYYRLNQHKKSIKLYMKDYGKYQEKSINYNYNSMIALNNMEISAKRYSNDISLDLLNFIEEICSVKNNKDTRELICKDQKINNKSFKDSNSHKDNISMANNFLKRKEYREALFFSEKALEISRLNENHHATAKDLVLLSNLHWMLSNYSNALNYLNDSYVIVRKYNTDLDDYMLYMAKLYKKTLHLPNAIVNLIPYMEFNRKIILENYGEDNGFISNIEETLAVSYYYIGNFTRSKLFLEHLLDKKIPLSDKSIEVLEALVISFRDSGYYDRSLKLMKRMNKIHFEDINKTHKFHINNLINMAINYDLMGLYYRAETLYSEAYLLAQQYFGRNDKITLWSLLMYINFHIQTTFYPEHMLLPTKNIYDTFKLQSKNKDYIIASRAILAQIYYKIGDLENAIILLLKNIESEYDDELAASSLFSSTINLSRIYLDLHKNEEALSFAKKKYIKYQMMYTEKHNNLLIEAKQELAYVYDSIDQKDKAIKLYEEIYEAIEGILDRDSLKIIQTRFSLAKLYFHSNKINNATIHLKNIISSVRNIYNRNLPIDSQQQLFEQFISSYFLLSKIYIKQGKTKDAFNLSEISKARTLLKSLINKFSFENFNFNKNENRTLQNYYEEILIKNNEISNSKNNLSKKIKIEDEYNILLGRFDKFRNKMYKKYPKYKKLNTIDFIDAESGKKFIPDNSVFISYFMHENEILVFTLKSNGTLTAHNLGNISHILENIKNYQYHLNNSRDIEFQVIDGFKNRNKVEKTLGEYLLDPLKEIISEKQNWIISPSGILSSLAFETLYFSNEKQPIISKHNVSYIQSLSVLSQLTIRGKAYNKIKSRKSLFAMGAPIYTENNLPKNNMVTSIDDNIAREMLLTRNYQTPIIKRLNLKWNNLPGALAELNALELIFEDTTPLIYRQEQATENNLLSLNNKGVLQQYQYLVFSTHGYLNLETPALSSVVLGQINNPPGTDGYVTASEWLRYNIKSDLIVLSACKTGLGKVINGEGITGLPYALYIAGTKNALLTLWSISDNATEKFITQFFNKIKSGVPQINALSKTKREFIKSDNYNHPRYWAAFILYGI